MSCNPNKSLSIRLERSYFFLLLVLILWGCDPIRKVEKSDESIRKVFDYGLVKGVISCLPEIKEVHTRDTTEVHDTSYVDGVIAVHDTLNNKDTVYRTRIITNTIHIRDTTRLNYRDLDKENALRTELARKEGEIKAKDEQIKQQKKDNNWWKMVCFITWGLMGVGGFFWIRSKLVKSLIPKI